MSGAGTADTGIGDIATAGRGLCGAPPGYFDFISRFAFLQWRRVKTLLDQRDVEPVPVTMRRRGWIHTPACGWADHARRRAQAMLRVIP